MRKEYKAKIDDGKVKVVLYNEDEERLGEILIDPLDFNILKRVKESEQQISEYVKQAEGKAADKDQGGDLETELEEIDQKIRELLNNVFNCDVCSTAFGGRHALSVSGGKYLFERLVEALAPVFEDMAKEEAAASKARVVKYTGKYQE